jgi:hypothetical protein
LAKHARLLARIDEKIDHRRERLREDLLPGLGVNDGTPARGDPTVNALLRKEEKRRIATQALCNGDVKRQAALFGKAVKVHVSDRRIAESRSKREPRENHCVARETKGTVVTTTLRRNPMLENEHAHDYEDEDG